eukprot:TRINITY_DN61113_c0_g1_i1.p2 TRINITY_DN61113_c0_g1~~TRINITY_DN61113_c0_g1_i1.p2  ORF type:complete len:628 (+),score=219.71 TRINITY_DN61113_c0_g1_i1:244-1884(+)
MTADERSRRRRRDPSDGSGRGRRRRRGHRRRDSGSADGVVALRDEDKGTTWLAAMPEAPDSPSGASSEGAARALAESRKRREAILLRHGGPAPPPDPTPLTRTAPPPAAAPAAAAAPPAAAPAGAAAAADPGTLDEGDDAPAFDMFGGGDEDALPVLRDDIRMVEQIEEGRDDIQQLRAAEDYTNREGYYTFKSGEVLANRYVVQGQFGSGVFSVVLRAQDAQYQKHLDRPETVALKVLRNNETMKRTGLKELEVLKVLQSQDTHNRKHCVRFYDSFVHRGHLCLVLEPFESNLREVLKRFGKDAGAVVGLSMSAVRSYTKQLCICLKHMRSCGVLHADFKPDNILVNANMKTVKLGDFGSAMMTEEAEITPYLVSRYYRAPEIMLGLPYSFPMDVWACGTVVYELFSGKFLFNGINNNRMLHLIQEVKGGFAKKMVRKAAFRERHFNDDLVFMCQESDPVTRKRIVRPRTYGAPVRPLKSLVEVAAAGTCTTPEEKHQVRNLWDFIDKCTTLDPALRLSPDALVAHPFVANERRAAPLESAGAAP